MGKFKRRKGKVSGDVGIMELSQSSSIGVQTRAKTLDLLKLSALNPPAYHNQPPQSHAYLQLRSRTLEKSPFPTIPPKYPNLVIEADCKSSPKTASNPGVRTSSKIISTDSRIFAKTDRLCYVGNNAEGDLGDEASFGDNDLEFQELERECTPPCSLLSYPESMVSPSRRAAATSTRRTQNAMHWNIPSTQELEELFAAAEQKQQQIFTKKYNFDFVNDLPLPPGRYEWVSCLP